MWTNPFQLGLVRQVLEDNGFKFIQILTWYKQSFNVVNGPACTFLPSTEVAVIAFHGNPTFGAQYLNMPLDPLQRHNILIGPKMGKRAVDTEGKEVNPCEKPEYVAEWILRKLTKPGDNVIIAGFGAGGDMRGALNADCNVYAIEQDLKQFNASKRMMHLFVPKPDLSMVVTRDQLTFGHQCLETLGPYRDNADGSVFTCPLCGYGWPGKGNLCNRCGYPFCHKCFDDENTLCRGCVQEEIDAKTQKVEGDKLGTTPPPVVEGDSSAEASGN